MLGSWDEARDIRVLGAASYATPLPLHRGFDCWRVAKPKRGDRAAPLLSAGGASDRGRAQDWEKAGVGGRRRSFTRPARIKFLLSCRYRRVLVRAALSQGFILAFAPIAEYFGSALPSSAKPAATAGSSGAQKKKRVAFSRSRAASG